MASSLKFTSILNIPNFGIAFLFSVLLCGLLSKDEFRGGVAAQNSNFQNCSSNNVVWSVDEFTVLNMLGCTEAFGLTLSIDGTKLNYSTLEFPYLTKISGSLVVHFKNGAVLDVFSFPALKQVDTSITIYVSGNTTMVGLVSFPVLERVYGSGITIYTYSKAGVIGSVYVGPPAGKTLSIGGAISVYTSSSNLDPAYNSIGNIVFEGLVSASKLSVVGYGGSIGNIYINKNSTDLSLSLTSDLTFRTDLYTSGAIGDLEIYGLAYTKTITFDARFAPIGNVIIHGSKTDNLYVVGAVTFLARKWKGSNTEGTGSIGVIQIERTSRMGSFSVSAEAALVGKVTVNANSPEVQWETFSGEIAILADTGMTNAAIESVYLRSLKTVRGNLRAKVNAGTIGNVTINNPNDPCTSLRLDGSLYVETSTSMWGSIGFFNAYSVGKVYGAIYAYVRNGSVSGYQVQAGSACSAGIEVTGSIVAKADVSTFGVLGPFIVSDVYRVYNNIAFRPYTMSALSNSIIVRGTPSRPIEVYNEINIDPANSYQGYLSSVLIEHVSYVGAITIYSDTSLLESIEIVGASKGLTCAGRFYLSTGSTGNESLSIQSLRITNLFSIGNIYFLTGNSQIGEVVVEGLPTGFDLGYYLHYGSTSTNPLAGSIQTLVVRNLRSVLNYINIQPRTSKFYNVSFSGPKFSVGGYIYFSFGLAYIENLKIDGLSSVVSYFRVLNNFASPGGLISVNSDPDLHPGTSLVIEDYLQVSSNTEFRISNLLSVGNYLFIDASSSYPQLPVTINGSFPGLDVYNYVRVVGSTSKTRTVTIDNIRLIRGGSSNNSIDNLSTLRFLDAYRSRTSYALGSVVINSRDVVSSPPLNGAYSASTKTNDPDCVNFCFGRGYGTYNTTAGKCELPCNCWPFNNGTYCEEESVCDFSPTCECRCGQWSSWTSVTAEASYRNRTTCNIAGTGLSCALTQLQGSIECTPDVEYEAAPPTPTSFRLCKAISPKCNSLKQYESSPYTAFSDRVCTNFTTCAAKQYISQVGTPSSDRICTNWTTCVSNEFLASPGNLNADAICQTCTDCGSSLVLQACAADSDTICKDCSPCDLLSNFIEVKCIPDQSIDTLCTPCSVCNYEMEYQFLPCGSYADTACANRTVCDPETQFQTSPGTQTTDRACSDLTVCDPNPNVEFEVKPSTLTTDRTCASTTSCTNNEFQLIPPTSTTDRSCQTLASVDFASEYISVLNTPTTDRTILPISACNPLLQYQTKAPTMTSDRVCTPALVCTPISQYQTVPLTATTDRQCVNSTPCQGTDIEFSPPTATSDRICVAVDECTSFQYESFPPTPTTQRVCANLTVCGTLQYESISPTPTSNRACSAYDLCQQATQYERIPRTYTSNPICANLTSCIGGLEYQFTAPDLTSDRVCASLSECDTCGGLPGCVSTLYMVKTFTPTSDRVCASIMDCGPINGVKYQTKAPTATTNRVCSNLTECANPNLYQSVPGTFSTDRQCATASLCSFGDFELVPLTPTSNRQCQVISDCSEFEYESAHFTATTDRICQPLSECQAGEFEYITYTDTSDRVCRPFTQCFDYQKESGKPGPYNDRECINDFCHKFAPCGNSTFGNCTNVGKSSFACSCNPQYYGKACSFTYPLCSEAPSLADPCQHEGICHKIPNTDQTGEIQYCACSSQYMGANCSTLRPVQDTSSAGSSFTSSPSFLGIVVALVVIVLVVAILIILYRSHVHRDKMSRLGHHNDPSKITSFENPHFVDAFAAQRGSYFKDEYYLEDSTLQNEASFNLLGNHGESQFNPAYIHQTLRTLTSEDTKNSSSTLKSSSSEYNKNLTPTMKSTTSASNLLPPTNVNTLHSVNEEDEDQVVQSGDFYDNVQGDKMVDAPPTVGPQGNDNGARRSMGYLLVEDK